MVDLMRQKIALGQTADLKSHHCLTNESDVIIRALINFIKIVNDSLKRVGAVFAFKYCKVRLMLLEFVSSPAYLKGLAPNVYNNPPHRSTNYCLFEFPSTDVEVGDLPSSSSG